MRSRLVIAAALIIAVAASTASVLASSAHAAGEITKADVDAALERRREASSSLEATTARFELAMADEEILRERIGDLARSVTRLEQEIGERRIAVRQLVMARYMSGGSLGTERVFTARTFTDLPLQASYLDRLNEHDLVTLRGLENAEVLHVEQQQLLDESLADQQSIVAELTDLATELGGALADADAEYASVADAYRIQEEERIRKEEELRRQREAAAAAAAAAAATSTTAPTTSTGSTTTTAAPSETTTTAAPVTTTTAPPPPPTAPPPVVTDGKTCPVNAAVSFSDTWGDPRSGGRTHKGVDMVAARNAPIVAIETGRVTRVSNSSLGGLSIYLTGSSGANYYYAHLEYIEAGIGGGSSVSVGDLLGGNGSSGNAPDWLPHLHFQYAPPGSDWVDPYPLVKALCG